MTTQATRIPEDDFTTARRIGLAHDMTLVQIPPHKDGHYQLIDTKPAPPRAGWLIDLWPSSRRYRGDKRRPDSPLLLFRGKAWTLIDAVVAAISETNRLPPRRH